jgi:predicted nucleic acid-binding protein
VIVVDTTVLVYAVGGEHPLREPARRVVEAVDEGRVRATTTAEVIQEFAHVRARRRGRKDAVTIARAYTALLTPLLEIGARELDSGLRLFERHHELGAFDGVVAAATIEQGADALVSADRAFAQVRRLPFVELGSPQLERLLGAS